VERILKSFTKHFLTLNSSSEGIFFASKLSSKDYDFFTEKLDAFPVRVSRFSAQFLLKLMKCFSISLESSCREIEPSSLLSIL
jgi:hypothetical protein